MKKRYFVGVVIVALGLGLSGAMTGYERDSAYADTAGDAWVNGTISRVTQQVVQGTPSSCQGLATQVTISGVGQRQACITQTDPENGVKFGRYGSGGTTNPIISFRGDMNFYQLTGFNGYNTRYSSISDVLVEKYDQYPGAGLRLYSDMSHHLKKVVEGDVVRYTLDETPVLPLKQSTVKTWYMNGYALSQNGRYVAVELMGDGIGVIDTDTMIVKRIANTGYAYGVGANPTVELAITNDGSTLVAVGSNAGLRAYHIDDSCGNYAIYDMSPVRKAPPQSECPSLSYRLTKALPSGWITMGQPVFSEDGSFLSLYLQDHLNNNFIVLSVNDSDEPRIPYLALGDSFTSGEGETDNSFYEIGTDTDTEKCHLSTRSYPFILAQAAGLNSSSARSVACSGATITDIFGDDATYWGQSKRLGSGGENLSPGEKQSVQVEALTDFIPGRVHQASFVEQYQPAELTIGIGGNDAGLFSKLQACAMPDTCEWASDTGRPEVAKEIQGLFPKLVNAYTKLKSLSPTTKVYAVNYPQPIDPTGKCDVLIATLLNKDERTLIAESVHYIDAVIAAAAAKAGVTLLDVEQSFGDEKLCDSTDQRAMNGIRTGNDSAPIELLKKFVMLGNETFHPTPYGHQLMASAVIASYGNIAVGGCTAASCRGNSTTIVPDPDTFWQGSVPPEDVPTAVQGSFLGVTEIKDSVQQLSVNLIDTLFAPNTVVRATVHSTPIGIGTMRADEVGGVTGELSLPTTLTAGYHTVHLEGESPSGEDLDVYQTFFYDPPGATNAVPDETAPETTPVDPPITLLPFTLPMADGGAATLPETDGGRDNATNSSPVAGAIEKVLGLVVPDDQASQIADSQTQPVRTLIGEAVKGARTVRHQLGVWRWWIVAGAVMVAGIITLLIFWPRKRDHSRR